MEYTVALTVNNGGEPTGLFSIFTTEEPLVFIFTNQTRLDQFLDAAAQASLKDGNKVGSTVLKANSMEEIVGNLLELDPSLQGTQFVPDSAPIFNDALEMLRAEVR